MDVWEMYSWVGIVLCAAAGFALFMVRYQEKHGIDPDNPRGEKKRDHR